MKSGQDPFFPQVQAYQQVGNQQDIIKIIQDLNNQSNGNKSEPIKASFFNSGMSSSSCPQIVFPQYSKSNNDIEKMSNNKKSNLCSSQQSKKNNTRSRKVIIRNSFQPQFQEHNQSELNQKQLKNNHKITDFFGVNKLNLKIERQESQTIKVQSNHSQFLIKAMKDTLFSKEEQVKELQKQIKYRIQKNQENLKTIRTTKQKQKKYLIHTLKQHYQRTIFYSNLARQTSGQIMNIFWRQNLKEVNNKLTNLKNIKVKSKKGKKTPYSDEEDISMMQIDDNAKKQYINSWIGKVQKQKDKFYIEKQVRKNIMDNPIYQLPQQLCQLFGKNPLENYLPLCSFTKLQKFQPMEILCMQLQTLKEEIIMFINYPPFLTNQRKIQLSHLIQQLSKESKKISNKYTIPNSFICHIYEKTNLISISRLNVQKSIPLKQILKIYDPLPQTIIKSIIRTCISVLNDAKIKTGRQYSIFASNIIFNQKYEIKVINLPFNFLYLQKQFKNYITATSDYLNYPPEAVEGDYSNISLWSIGILLYQLIYGTKPFGYDLEADRYTRQQFFIIYEVQFLSKPVISDRCKEFIKLCLNKDPATFKDAFKHSYFANK